MEVLVVGGGVGGLSAALAISRLRGVLGVRVLEAQESVGGRMRTHYGPDQRPLYEEGAWRIPNEHRRMMRLCSDLRLEMMEVASEGSESTTAWLDPDGCRLEQSSQGKLAGSKARRSTATEAPVGIPCPRGTLSSWDVAAERLGIQGADLEAARSGYAGMGVMAAGSDSYGVETAEKATLRASARYYVPTEGMSSICARLKEELERRPRCHVHLKTRVVDVRPADKGYMVLCEERVGGHAFSGKSFRADAVIAAVPPSHVAKWQGVAERLAPVLAALSPVPLLKVFSETGPEFAAATGLRGPFHIKSNTLGQQMISNTYPGTDFVQLAYCAGPRAEALERLRLCGDHGPAVPRDPAVRRRPAATAPGGPRLQKTRGALLERSRPRLEPQLRAGCRPEVGAGVPRAARRPPPLLPLRRGLQHCPGLGRGRAADVRARRGRSRPDCARRPQRPARPLSGAQGHRDDPGL